MVFISGLTVPGFLFLPTFLSAYLIIGLFYKIYILKVIRKFLLIWVLFFIVVGIGRFIAGVDLASLIKDCSFGLGLAVAISCSMLLLLNDNLNRILLDLDKAKIPRTVSYAFIALIALLPKVKSTGARQLELLRLKGALAGKPINRILAYRRIAGPLFTLLLTRQYAHALSLNSRGFFIPPDVRHLPYCSGINAKLCGLVFCLLINLLAWHRLSQWIM